MDWWQASNELHQRAFWSPLDNPTRLEAITNPPAGCVWELEVIDFERRAWLTDVLGSSAGPGFEQYLARQCNTDV